MTDRQTAPGPRPVSETLPRHSLPPAHLRDPLAVAALTEAAARLGLRLAVTPEIDSTNAELARLARGLPGHSPLASDPVAPPAGPMALVAERQSAGRGRLDRSWQSPVGAGLTVSMLVRPTVQSNRLGWLPMVVGTSLVRTLRGFAGVPAVLKWPNDVQVDGAKLAGILVELVPSPGSPPAAVIGFGLNVTTTADELPPRSASLLLLDAHPAALDRTALLVAVLTDLTAALRRWESAPEQARADYRAVCATLGRQVRVELPDSTSLVGIATDVDEAGRLVVDGRPFSAADIVHLR